MSLRDVPADDLYARLELPRDAGPEAIEIAWRSLLKRHHPDVAGESSLEAAKRINVAHDWLSDPDLRARYDRARGSGPRSGYAWTPRGRGAGDRRAAARGTARPAGRPRHTDPLAALRERDVRPPDLDLDSAPVADILDRASRLTVDELDRLALAEQPPIAFIASIRRFLPPERRTVLDGVEAAVAQRLPEAARGRPGIADAVTSVVQVLVLDGFLADSLTDPFRERVEERMTRGWDAAVGHRRYGPNTTEVAALVARARRLGEADVARVLDAARKARLGSVRWPRGTDPAEDEALRISVELAGQDAAAAIGDASLPINLEAAVRRVVANLAGVVALRPAYPASTYAALTEPFESTGLVAASTRPRR